MTASHIADEFISTIIRALHNRERTGISVPPEFLERFVEELKGPVQIDVLNQMKQPPRLNVMATTAELREAGPSDLLARLSFTITEEGVEWTVTESQGKKQERLVPE
jgi:hypothetical protein